MAAIYGLKYELFFSDLQQRQFKVEIHKKNYDGAVSNLVGTGNPVEIIWDKDDDIYSPIMGSRCKLNLFVTDDTDYDEFFNSDEREYLLKILHYDDKGGFLPWEQYSIDYNLNDNNWDSDLGSISFYYEIWEGFIVVDRFREQMTPKPYPITLEAIDGLGTLDAFDAPFDTTNTTGEKNLFYYLKEILKITGHEHNIYIANDIRKVGGNANDTIFHDIVVNEYSFFSQKLTSMNAKKVLKEILSITNSRLFLSYGHWYVVNNSSLIDKDIDQLALAPSGSDTGEEQTVEYDPFEEIIAPSVLINNDDANVSAVDGTNFGLAITNSGGDIDTWSYVYGSTTINGTGNNTDVNIQAVTANNNVTLTFTATNTSGSSSDTITLLVTSPVTPEVGDSGGTLRINTNNGVANTRVTPSFYQEVFDAGQVGDSFVVDFLVRANAGYQFTDVNQITSIVSSAGYTIGPKTLSGGGITFRLSGYYPSGGLVSTLDIVGSLSIRRVTTTITLDNQIANSTIVGNPAVQSYTSNFGTIWRREFYVNADSGYYFDNIDRLSANYTTGSLGQLNRVIVKHGDNIKIVVHGTQPPSNQSLTLTLTGEVVQSNDADSFETGLSANDVGYTTSGLITATSTPSLIQGIYLFQGVNLLLAESTTFLNGDYYIDFSYPQQQYDDFVAILQSRNYIKTARQFDVNGESAVNVRFAGDRVNFMVGFKTFNGTGSDRFVDVNFRAYPSGTIIQTSRVTQRPHQI